MSPDRRTRRARRGRRRQDQGRLEQLMLASGTPPLVAYWESRYVAGGASGKGSVGESAERKARYVNDLVRRERVTSVVDWGCGDGRQLDLLNLPGYLGVDISPTAVSRCLARHPGRAFMVWPGDTPVVAMRAELALSLDVIFHLLEDHDFAAYWRRLFDSATRLVCVHSTDFDGNGARHVRHHRHSDLAPTGWTLADKPSDASVAGFYLWKREVR